MKSEIDGCDYAFQKYRARVCKTRVNYIIIFKKSEQKIQSFTGFNNALGGCNFC